MWKNALGENLLALVSVVATLKTYPLPVFSRLTNVICESSVSSSSSGPVKTQLLLQSKAGTVGALRLGS